ncbi:MAG: patatin-like phospholipase family protein [Micromonosporaceae bacterium]
MAHETPSEAAVSQPVSDIRVLGEPTSGTALCLNASNMQTGKLFRFSRPCEGDYSVGLWRDPATGVADAVAASSAFPPVLSPHTVRPPGRFDLSTAGEHRAGEFRERVWLSDGGVYGNLGFETAWKRCRRILVSDGGRPLEAEPAPQRNWALHGVRVLEIVDSQVRALRKRQFVNCYQQGFRDGTYWGIRSEAADYHLGDPVAIPEADVTRARSVKTRLSRLDDAAQRALINWGYAIADTAIRRWADPNLAKPSRPPIP